MQLYRKEVGKDFLITVEHVQFSDADFYLIVAWTAGEDYTYWQFKEVVEVKTKREEALAFAITGQRKIIFERIKK